MTAWRGSRIEPAPITRELVVCAVLAGLGLLMLAPLVGQSLVLFAITGELAWPANPIPALVALAQGRPGVGLPSEAAGRLPTTWLVVTASAGTELGVLGLLATVLRAALRRSGLLGVRGLADPREAARALGVRELKRRGPVIRPDLHSATRRQDHDQGRDR
jgi:hypothetical protein